MTTEYITDVIDPAELTGYVREATANGRPFDAWLPPRSVDDIEYELQNYDGRNAMQVAKYRSWDTAPPLGKRPGVATIVGEIPPMGLSLKLSEKDIIRLNKIRAGVATSTDQDVVDKIFNDALTCAMACDNRLTWAVSDLLQDGSVTVEGSTTGGTVQATFSVPANQLGVTPASAAWTDHAASVPVTDIAAWQKIFRTANGGRNPDFWITSSTVVADLSLNAQVRNLSPANADGSARGIVTDTTVAQVLSANKLAPIVPIDLELPQVSSDDFARVIPERAFIGIIVDTLGETLFAPSANASNLAGNGTLAFSDIAGVVAFVEKTIRPASVLTTGEAVALPVLRDPNALFSATV